MPARSLPLRAMTRLLAEMQTSLMARCLPIFGGRVDRFMVFSLLIRRAMDGDRTTPTLAIAESLGLPFETTRRHVIALTEAGVCRRERAGLVAGPALAEEPYAALPMLAHDCLVRLIEDLATLGALPTFPAANRSYDWRVGAGVAADLMLSVAETNRGTHHDRLDLVLFSTIMCATMREVTSDPALSRRYATIAQVPPEELRRPIRIRRLALILGLAEATVRLRIDRLLEGPVEEVREGLVIREAWQSSPEAVRTSAASWANLRRLLGALAAQGFPITSPATAYVAGRPPLVPLGNGAAPAVG